MDKTLLDPPESQDKPAPSPMPPPSTPDNSQSSSLPGDKAPSTPKNEQGSIVNFFLNICVFKPFYFCFSV